MRLTRSYIYFWRMHLQCVLHVEGVLTFQYLQGCRNYCGRQTSFPLHPVVDVSVFLLQTWLMHLAFLVTIFRVTELHILALKNRPSCQIPCLSRNKHGVKLGDYYNAAIPRKFMTICKNVTFNVMLESKTRRILKCGGGFIICRGNMSVTVCIHSTLAVSPAATVFFPSWFYPVQRGRHPA